MHGHVVTVRRAECPPGPIRIKDDGILDCLCHFADNGNRVVLCTYDKQLAVRAEVRALLSF